MTATREEAAQKAEAARTNSPGTCQLWTRTLYGAPSAGDFDHDGDADAVDGWASEPRTARHPGDRNPPRGVPVAWDGGSHGYGHRAISLGGGKIRSTDAGGSGKVATVDLSWPEEHWGLHYLGWSETIDGQPIPDGDPAPPPKPLPHTKYVADYSTARPDPHALVAAGFRGVMRYISPPGGIPKDLTRDEAAKLHAAGLWIGLVWESTAGRAGEGSDAGAADARAADAAADALGYPADAAIFYAVDYDTTPARVSAYFTGLHETSKRPVGIYGGVKVIDAGLAKFAWQTEAWSGGKVSAKADMLQHTKPSHSIPSGVDENVLQHRRRWLVWKPVDVPTPEPVPTPTPHHGHIMATLNIKSFPTMPQSSVVADLAKAVEQASVLFLQEIGPQRYKDAVAALPSEWTAAHLETECPIVFRNDIFTQTGPGARLMTHKGRALVSPNRYDTWVPVQTRHGADIALLDKHCVSGGWSKGFKSFRKWRRKMWAVDHAKTVELVAYLVGRGFTVVGAGDFNRKLKDIPLYHPDMEWVTDDLSAIDGIFVVRVSGGARVEAAENDTVKGWFTDHFMRRVWLKIRKAAA